MSRMKWSAMYFQFQVEYKQLLRTLGLYMMHRGFGNLISRGMICCWSWWWCQIIPLKCRSIRIMFRGISQQSPLMPIFVSCHRCIGNNYEEWSQSVSPPTFSIINHYLDSETWCFTLNRHSNDLCFPKQMHFSSWNIANIQIIEIESFLKLWPWFMDGCRHHEQLCIAEYSSLKFDRIWHYTACTTKIKVFGTYSITCSKPNYMLVHTIPLYWSSKPDCKLGHMKRINHLK